MGGGGVAAVVTPGWHGFITQEARLVTGQWPVPGRGNMQTDKAVWEQMKVAVKGTKI